MATDSCADGQWSNPLRPFVNALVNHHAGDIIVSELGFSWPTSRFSRPWKGPQEIGKQNYVRLVSDVVREMESVVERTQDLAKQGTLQGYHYPQDIKGAFLRRTRTTSFSLQELVRATANIESPGQTDPSNTSEDLSRQARLAARFFDDSICDFSNSPPVMVFGLLTGMLNHSCTPNAFLEVQKIKGSGNADVKLTIRATHFIPVGQEITILYSDAFGASTTSHRMGLKEIFGFDCCCSLCVLTREDVNWRSLRDLCHEMVCEFFTQEIKPPQMYRLACLIIDGCYALHLDHPVFEEILDKCSQVALKESDFFRARYFQCYRLRLCTRYWGHGSETAADAREKVRRIETRPEATTVMDSIKWEPVDGNSVRLTEIMFMMHRTDEEYYFLRVEDGNLYEFPKKEARLREGKFWADDSHQVTMLLMNLDVVLSNSNDQLNPSQELSPSPASPKKSKSTKKKKKKNAVAKAQKVPQRTFENDEPSLEHDESEEDQVGPNSELENEKAASSSAASDTKNGPSKLASRDVNTHGRPQPRAEALDVSPKSAPAQLTGSQSTLPPTRASVTDHVKDGENEANTKSTSRGSKFGRSSANNKAGPNHGRGRDSNVKGNAASKEELQVKKPRFKHSPPMRNHEYERSGNLPDNRSRHSNPSYQQRPKARANPPVFYNPPMPLTHLPHDASIYTIPKERQSGPVAKTQKPMDRVPPWVGKPQLHQISTASDATMNYQAIHPQARIPESIRESGLSNQNSSAPEQAAPDKSNIESPVTALPLPDDILDSVKPVIRVNLPTGCALPCGVIPARKPRDSRASSPESVSEGSLTRRSQESRDLTVARAYFRPYLCPFGDPEGMSKQMWLSNQTSKTHLVIIRRDIAHLIAAKDGTGSKDSGFVLSSRRDSMTGRIEGRKELIQQRLRRHSFNNDGGLKDRLKEAETW